MKYNPNIDWIFTDKDKLPDKPKAELPDQGFVILKPAQTFESDINACVVAQHENAKRVVGSVRPGVHVFQMVLSAWNHPGEASEFAKSWQKFGELITGLVTTEPLEIQIPSSPKVETECK